MTINLLQNINYKLFKTISKVASSNNQSVFLVGGYVRDLLLERAEPSDIDFVTEQNGIDLAIAVAAELDPRLNVTIFKTYGTAMFKFKDKELEFVGARKESYTQESRNPKVSMGSIEDDQKRRDFTINAMAISLNPENFGELIDPFDGIMDLRLKILRTPQMPSETYSDDPLRMMRAIRFASVLDFTIDQSSLDAIKIESNRLKIVSIERVMTEFNKILLSVKPSIGLKLLYETNLLHFILPEIIALKGVEEIEGQSHKDNFWHTLEVVDNIAKNTDSLWLRWAALLHDIGKAPTKKYVDGIGWTFHGHEFLGSKMVKGIFHRLKLPLNQDMKYVQKIVKLSSRPIALIDNDASDSALRRLLLDAGDDLEDLFILCKADITTKNRTKRKQYKENFELVSEKIKTVEEKDHIRNFQPPITGDDLMEIYHLPAGPWIGEIKSQIKEAILEGKIPNDKKSAMEYVRMLNQ